jgi:hypothetical protein
MIRLEAWMMKLGGLKCMLALSCGLLAFAGSATAKGAAANGAPETSRIIYFPVHGADRAVGVEHHLVAKAINLTYHGGQTITSAKVVLIFWGPTFNNTASPDYNYARTIINYRNQFGTTDEYRTITQYSGIQVANLGSGTADWFDTSTPPVNVTDAAVQGEVNRYLASHAFDASAVYEVFLPRASYSSNGTSTSCGGPGLAYCAYHSWIGSGASAKKYSIQPYPSCAGCQVAGWSDVQNQEHFVSHETRETVTDATGNAWYDINGNEADDKCAWSPAPFLGTGGYGYQYEWSNAASACIQTLPAAPLAVAPISCSGNYRGSTQIVCNTSVSGGTPPYTLTWSYSGTASSWYQYLQSAYANYNPPGCGASGGSTFNGFVATATDAAGQSTFASISPLSCY